VLSAFLTFMPVVALLIVAPGPDSPLVLPNSARSGRRGGAATAAGTVTRLLVRPSGAVVAVGRRGQRAQYLAGAGTNLLNAKVGVFFIGFLPAFIPRGVPVAQSALVLGGVFVAERP
jgi:threonine/homoserine/homoserine lactone efflux protein